MTVGEVCRRHTHRQFQAQLAWTQRQWNEPDRHDHYIMRLMAVVSGAKDEDKFRIVFKSREPVKPVEGMTMRQLKDLQAKMMWINRLPGKIRVID